jgi:hypothetical protein
LQEQTVGVEIIDYFVFVNVHLTVNWTKIKMCSVVHGNQLFIQELITVLPSGDNMLFRHVKLGPVILTPSLLILRYLGSLRVKIKCGNCLSIVASSEGIKTKTKKCNNVIWVSNSGAGELILQSVVV